MDRDIGRFIRKKLHRQVPGKFWAGTTRLTKYFQILTRNLSEKPYSKKNQFFRNPFLMTWRNKPSSNPHLRKHVAAAQEGMYMLSGFCFLVYITRT